MRGKSRALVAIALSAGAALFLSTAFAQAPTITSKLLVRGKVGKLNARNGGVVVKRKVGSADVVMNRFVFQPGSSSGWHKHPGVALVTVKSGALQIVNRFCRKKVYRKGQVYVEQGHKHLGRNRGNKKAVVLVTFIVPSKVSADGLFAPQDPPQGCNAR
jgi:quercetin dioxygenase-like cupin family protein